MQYENPPKDYPGEIRAVATGASRVLGARVVDKYSEGDPSTLEYRRRMYDLGITAPRYYGRFGGYYYGEVDYYYG